MRYSSEVLISYRVLQYMCLSNQFKCPSNGTSRGLCIDKSKVCDGKPDCHGEEDEHDCQPKTCQENKFRCNDSYQ